MTSAPRFWRRTVADYAMPILSAAVVVALIAFAVRQWAITIREAERARTLTAMHATFATELTMARDAWARTVRQRDTVVVTKVRTVRETIARVPDSVRVLVPVVDTVLVECAALAAASDSLHDALAALHVAQATADTATAAVLVARSDTIARVMRQAQRKPGWRSVALASLAGFVVGVVR